MRRSSLTQIRRADSQPSDHRLIERVAKRQRADRERAQAVRSRMPIVKPAPDKCGSGGDRRKQRVREMDETEEHRRNDDAFAAGRRALSFAEDDRLKYPLLRPSPEHEGCQTAEEIPAIVQRAERNACADDQEQGHKGHHQCTPQPREQAQTMRIPVPIAEVVPGRKDDNESRRNDNRAARYVRLDEPNVNEDACQDRHREWHEAILPGISIRVICQHSRTGSKPWRLSHVRTFVRRHAWTIDVVSCVRFAKSAAGMQLLVSLVTIWLTGSLVQGATRRVAAISRRYAPSIVSRTRRSFTQSRRPPNICAVLRMGESV